LLIVENKFAYVHVPKTAGSYITKILQNSLNTETIDKNNPHIYPLEVVELVCPVLCTVRNPFDWYVSWVHYFKTTRKINPMYTAITNAEDIPFKEILMNLLSDNINIPDSEFKSYSYSKNYLSMGERIYTVTEMKSNDIGFLTWIMKESISCITEVTVMKYENFKEELPAYLENIGIPNASIITEIAETPVINKSLHDPDFMSYYDDELIELVLHKDRKIFERFGYDI